VATALAAATVAAASGVSAVAPDSIAALRQLAAAVDLSAVVTPGSATNWNADGIDKFYGIDWNALYGPTVVAQFHLLADWIQVNAIDEALKTNPDPNIVLSSGRGAGNASALISSYVHHNDPTLYQTDWILDNNVDRPNGGYASRLPFFALVAVNPIPTPTDTGAHIIDVGYEYAWNSSVPLYVGNLVALLNSITEYAYRYRKQDTVTLPPEVLAPDAAPGHYIVDTQGNLTYEPLSATNTTVYVTYESKDLAMLRPIRDFLGLPGKVFADLVEPSLKVIVDSGYQDNNAMSAPDVYTPMRLLPPPKVVINAAKGLPAAVQQGIAAARADIENACATAKTASSTRAALDAPKPRVAASAASAGNPVGGNPVAGEEKWTQKKPTGAPRSAAGSFRARD
jgi:hypothetical protein